MHNSLLLFSRPSLRVVDVFFLEGLGSVSFASTRHCIFISASAGGCQSLVEVFALDPLLVFVSFFRIFPSPFCYSVWRKHASMAPPFLLLKGNCTDYFLNFSLPPLPVRNEIVRRSLDASRLLFRSALLVYQVPMAVFTKVCRSEISCSLNLLHQVCMAGLCLCPLSSRALLLIYLLSPHSTEMVENYCFQQGLVSPRISLHPFESVFP